MRSKFWQFQNRYFDVNLEDDDGQMVRIGDVPHNTALNLLEIGSKEVSKVLQFPAIMREVLDKLQLRVGVFCDRLEVNALFPVPPIGSHKCSSS